MYVCIYIYTYIYINILSTSTYIERDIEVCIYDALIAPVQVYPCLAHSFWLGFGIFAAVIQILLWIVLCIQNSLRAANVVFASGQIRELWFTNGLTSSLSVPRAPSIPVITSGADAVMSLGLPAATIGFGVSSWILRRCPMPKFVV